MVASYCHFNGDNTCPYWLLQISIDGSSVSLQKASPGVAVNMALFENKLFADVVKPSFTGGQTLI